MLRRGVSTLWVILSIPVFLTLLVLATDTANIWLARVELENGLESAALAAVKHWGDAGGGPTLIPRNVGVQYAAANTVLGTPLAIATNYNASNTPNENDTCDGNLVFGGITDMGPVTTFDASAVAGCTPATVFIDLEKSNSGNSSEPRMFGIFYDAGPANLSIRSVSFTIPLLGNNSQQPFFDGSGASGKKPIVSTAAVPADALNRFNAALLDYRGLDVDPVSGTDNWLCPAPPPPVINPNGDICFEFSDLIPFMSDRYRTLTIWFKDGAFTTTNNPATTDFVRFGASINQFNPPAVAGAMNNGDSFGMAGVQAKVTFFNSTTMTTQSVTQTFVDVPAPFRSEVSITGSNGQDPGVQAQATLAVPSLWQSLFGIPFGPYEVSLHTTARYDCSAMRPRLVRIDDFICP